MENRSEIKRAERYKRADVISFAKVTLPFGGLHNMAPGFPIQIDDITILTSEHLYQAMRFPHRPDIQEKILSVKSPMAAKMVMREHIDCSRPDWEQVKVPVMLWCIMLKLLQNWDSFGELLRSTKEKPLVEYSKKDDFWGALPENDELVGMNMLGKLLMAIRAKLDSFGGSAFRLEPPVPEMVLRGKSISTITFQIPDK